MKRNTLLIVICFLAATISFAQTSTKTTSSSASIEIASIPDQTFTGSALTPEPVIKFGSLTLKKDTDYTLSYSNNINVGTATITISGKGNYSDTKTVNFKIVPKSFGGGSTATSKSTATSSGVSSTATPAK